MKMKLAGLLFGALLASTSLFAANGSCGAGKCGGEMKKEMHEKKSSSCGAGKCGGEMKNDMSKMNNDMKDMRKDMNNDMKEMKKDMKQDIKGSCGNGKCGSK